MSAALELITIGRVGVDLYPQQGGRSLADVETFAKSLGGSPVNVAVAASRLGLSVAAITKVGDDAFGVYVCRALAGFGVDGRWVGTDPDLRTPSSSASCIRPIPSRCSSTESPALRT